MVFIYCLLSFFKKYLHIHVFVWVVKMGLLTQQILLFEHCIELSLAVNFQTDALRDLVPFVQFKKREKHP